MLDIQILHTDMVKRSTHCGIHHHYHTVGDYILWSVSVSSLWSRSPFHGHSWWQ